MIWTKIHRWGVYGIAGAVLFGAGAVSSTAQYGLPRLWKASSEVPMLRAENQGLRVQLAPTRSKTDAPTDNMASPDGITTCPVQQNGWHPPMREL